MLNLWAKRVAASLGCLLVFVGSLASAEALLPRSWHDLDDANIRMQIFRHHVFDWDFTWSAVAFGTNVVVVAAMFLTCMWMLWLLVSHWDMSPGKDEGQS